MKTNYLIATLAAFFLAAAGHAAGTPEMNIVPVGNEKFVLVFNADDPCPVEISVCTQKGERIYHWKTTSPCSELKKEIQVNRLGRGTYHVCLNYGGRSINCELFVGGKEISVGPAVSLHEPFFRYENNRLDLSFLNVAQKNVYLNIFRNGEHVTGVNLGNEMAIQKSLDISNLEKGEYSVVVSEYFKDHPFLVRK